MTVPGVLTAMMMGGGGGTFYDEVIADSPVAYWTMNGPGTTEEISGNNLTLNNGVLIGQSPILTTGDAILLDGVNDNATAASLGLSVLPITVEMLVRIETATNFTPLFATNDASNYYGLLIQQHSDGYLFLSFGDGTGTGPGDRKSFKTANGSILPSTDYHLVIRANSFSSIDVFINGTKQAATFVSGTAPTVSFSSGVPAISLSTVGGTPVYSNHTHDDTAVYDAALSDSRILAHFAATGL